MVSCFFLRLQYGTRNKQNLLYCYEKQNIATSNNGHTQKGGGGAAFGPQSMARHDRQAVRTSKTNAASNQGTSHQQRRAPAKPSGTRPSAIAVNARFAPQLTQVVGVVDASSGNGGQGCARALHAGQCANHLVRGTETSTHCAIHKALQLVGRLCASPVNAAARLTKSGTGRPERARRPKSSRTADRERI
ncbi:hypothetical protein CAOG_009660 [Capsaspora owczarzaki ATCC 30864]|uniref:Uncharacterized protein n=1 Tax=Capsaspora owczarzaki (strain ATCC 30864) TaxID=595528 RepID=A0A0D2WN29_CAPO3|nr:hypothetical protein CAOG_009660 [Capsaspora owczarzaki ATCC 30864]